MPGIIIEGNSPKLYIVNGNDDSEVFSIDSNGNIGIGTRSPSEPPTKKEIAHRILKEIDKKISE